MRRAASLSALVLAVTISVASAQPASAEPSVLIAYAADSGTRNLSSGFDSGVSKPKKMVLKVKVEPNVRIELEYDVYCRGNGQRQGFDQRRRTRSRRIPLPLPFDEPRGCLVYAFATLDGPVQREVKFRIELRAKSRGHQPPPPDPIPPEDVRARLKVEPRTVTDPPRVAVRAIGKDAGRFITGIDLRLDRPDGTGGWEPAYLLFAGTADDSLSGDPIALPPEDPVFIPLVGVDPRARRAASLEGVSPGAYRLRMSMSPDGEDRGFPDNLRLYRELEVLAAG